MIKTALVSLTCLLIAGEPALANEKPELIDPTLVQRFAMDPFEKSAGQNPIFYNDLSEILERFGVPLETVESKFPDRTSDATLTSYLLRYDGLEIALIESEDKQHSWPDSYSILGNTHPMKFGIRIGTAYGDFLDLLQLDPPGYREKNSPMNLYADVGGYWPDYLDESGQPKHVYGYLTVSFFFDDEDKIEKISFWMYSH